MAGDVDNPRIWVNADVYVGYTDSSGPTDLTTPLDDEEWTPLGLLSEDGLTETRADEQTDHYAWGGILVRTTRSKHKRTFVVTALEKNPAVMGVVSPGYQAETAAGVTTERHYVPTPNPRSFVFEFIDGDNVLRRYIPRGEVTEVGDVTFSDSEMAGYELTITVYPASDGLLYTDYTDDPQADIGDSA